ncbi:hypothetical protein QTP88_023229 [Uroleucon formosanum]
MTGSAKGESVFIPRIPMIPSDYPFQFTRMQFLVKDNSEIKWIIKSFENYYIKNIPDGILAKELFINLTRDSTLKTAFKTKKITNFWLDIKQEY